MTLRSKWPLTAVLLLLPVLSTPQAQATGAELWRSSLHDLIEVTVEKQAKPAVLCPGCPVSSQAPLQELPPEIVAKAGKNALD
jgi:hypothetical protein